MKLLGRLKLWQKLSLIVVVLLVPTTLLGLLYLSEVNADLGMMRSERDGAIHFRDLEKVADDVSLHLSATNAVLAGDKARKAEMLAIQNSFESHAGVVDAGDAKFGERFKSTAPWQGIKSDWAKLKAGAEAMSQEEARAAHNAVLDKVRVLEGQVGMESKLSLDPDPVTYSMIGIATMYMPTMKDQYSIARDLAVASAYAGTASEGARVEARISAKQATDAMGDFDGSLAFMADLKSPAVEKLKAMLAAAQGEYTSLAKLLDDNLWRSGRATMEGGRLYEASAPAMEKMMAAAVEAQSSLIADLERRIGVRAASRAQMLTMIISCLIMALLLSWVVTRSLTRPMTHAIDVFSSISKGIYDRPVSISGTDEVGQVLSSLDDMQGKLRAQIEAERRQSAENARIRQALDKVSTSVVLADAGNEIIYLNESAQQVFTQNESEMRSALPGLKASHLHGASLGSLMRDEGQRRRIEELSGSAVDEGRYGACTFRVVMNPVVGVDGARLGTVLEWTNRTQEVAVEEEVARIVAQAVDGDLRGRISTEDKTGFYEKLATGMNGLLENMSTVVGVIKGAAVEVQTGSEEISQGNANLSRRTEEQASSLEQTASAIEQLTSTVKQNADNAGQASQLAFAARDQADKGGSVVASAVRAMSEINDSSKKIADIISVIDNIAFQTNLLALNAAVEAARAGEQGRGFAVVASEVRSLAQRSATAAKEIKDLINDSVKKVDEGSVLVTQSGSTLDHIVASVKKVSDIVAEIAAASQEQSAGIEQVSKAVMQLDELTQQNAALVEEAAAASESMADQARGLGSTIGRYQVAGVHQVAAKAAPEAPKVAKAAAERRSASRPWTQGAKPTARSAAKPAVKSAAKPATGPQATGTDDEWMEF